MKYATAYIFQIKKLNKQTIGKCLKYKGVHNMVKYEKLLFLKKNMLTNFVRKKG